PVTVGFIAGIAVILFVGQIHDLLGLTLTAKEPAEFVPKIDALRRGISTINPAAVGVALGTIGIIAGLRRIRPRWPGMLIAITLGALATAFLGLPIEPIGTRFGSIPHMLPLPALPPLSLAKLFEVLPDAIAFALLGAIESLLSAVAADGMTGR